MRPTSSTAPASRERGGPKFVFVRAAPRAGATRVDVTSVFGAEDGRKRIGDTTAALRQRSPCHCLVMTGVVRPSNNWDR